MSFSIRSFAVQRRSSEMLSFKPVSVEAAKTWQNLRRQKCLLTCPPAPSVKGQCGFLRFILKPNSRKIQIWSVKWWRPRNRVDVSPRTHDSHKLCAFSTCRLLWIDVGPAAWSYILPWVIITLRKNATLVFTIILQRFQIKDIFQRLIRPDGPWVSFSHERRFSTSFTFPLFQVNTFKPVKPFNTIPAHVWAIFSF